MSSETAKFCPKCKETLPRSEFHCAKHTKDGLQGYCKGCMRDQSREWSKEHPDANRRYKANAIERRARELAMELIRSGEVTR
jgi:hypothetical protein